MHRSDAGALSTVISSQIEKHLCGDAVHPLEEEVMIEMREIETREIEMREIEVRELIEAERGRRRHDQPRPGRNQTPPRS